MNDVFDIFNGRFILEGINESNWEQKKKILDDFLFILNETEKNDSEDSDDVPKKMFMSHTTLQAWRTNVHALKALTHELLYDAKYLTVLTGKFNQDPVEVCFLRISYRTVIL